MLGCLSLLILDVRFVAVNLFRSVGAGNDLFCVDNVEFDTVGILFALLTDVLSLMLVLIDDDKQAVDLLLLFIILGGFKFEFEDICIDGDLS